MPPRHVVLVGLMGSGKSSIGRPLARRVGREYLDNDDVLELRTGHTAREIASDRGLDALHEEEANAFREMLADPKPAVIGAAASVVVDPGIRDLLREHDVVWLDTDLDHLARRVDAGDHRPFLGDDRRAALQAQWDARAPFYREVASLVVHPDREDDERIVDEIAQALI
ncbi:MAG: shikimate kinase [Acidimicrobiia bacterium]